MNMKNLVQLQIEHMNFVRDLRDALTSASLLPDEVDRAKQVISAAEKLSSELFVLNLHRRARAVAEAA